MHTGRTQNGGGGGVEVDTVRSELKHALITGNMHEVEKLLRQARNVEAFTPMEIARIQMAIERAKFGVSNPIQDPELYALMAKL